MLSFTNFFSHIKHPFIYVCINLKILFQYFNFPQLKVLLTSLYINNPETPCRIFLMHRNIPETTLNNLSNKLRQFRYELHPVSVDEAFFIDGPTMKQYPQEMYYRLLAGLLLPDNIDRILSWSGYPYHKSSSGALPDRYGQSSFCCRCSYRKNRTCKQCKPSPSGDKWRLL